MFVELLVIGLILLVGVLLISRSFLSGAAKNRVQALLELIRIAVESVEQSTNGRDWGEMTPEQKNDYRRDLAVGYVKTLATETMRVKWTPALERAVTIAIEAEVYKLFSPSKLLPYTPGEDISTGNFITIPTNSLNA